MSDSTPVRETACLPAAGRLAVAALIAENQKLRQQLDGLMTEARANQDKLRRFDRLERRVIAAGSMGQLVDIVLNDYPALFELDVVTLTLIDADYEIARLLGAGEPAQLPRLVMLTTDTPMRQLIPDLDRPWLGKFDATLAPMFPDSTLTPQSVAILPLVHQGRSLGSLNLGSLDPGRYMAGHRTDFLERLAALLSVCVQGALGNERLKLAGLTDGLTGVHNRRYFESRCREEVQAARRSKLPLVCLMLDVDHFKRVNDTHGHPAGDAVLRYIARLIRAQLRGNDLVARYGGEEFVILLPATPVVAALEIAERIRRVIAAQSMPIHAPLSVTVSMGLAELTLGSDLALVEDQVMHMIERADQALYRAKQDGRNRVVRA